MQENVLFSREIYTTGKNFTLPAVVPVVKNIILSTVYTHGEMDVIQT